MKNFGNFYILDTEAKKLSVFIFASKVQV